VGDEAEIFGTQLSAEGLAKVCGTIVHEVLARISSRVSRVYVRDF
jgi:alanine racemase